MLKFCSSNGSVSVSTEHVTDCMLLEGECSGPGRGGTFTGILVPGSSFWPSLVILPLGEKEAMEGLSGRGLVMSRCICGRVMIGNLAWMLLEEELRAEAPLMVGRTAPRGGEPINEAGSGTTGDEGLLREAMRRLAASDPKPRWVSEPVGTSPSSLTFRLSPMDIERDILAMELVVGLMYERGLDLVGVGQSLGWVAVGLERGTLGTVRRGVDTGVRS